MRDNSSRFDQNIGMVSEPRAVATGSGGTLESQRGFLIRSLPLSVLTQTDCRLKPGSNVVVQFAFRPSPQTSPRGRGSHYPYRRRRVPKKISPSTHSALCGIVRTL